jgi:hypothetical protein
MLRLFMLLMLYSFAFALLGTGLWLGVGALSQGAMPHLWLFGALLLGGMFLHHALRLTRRFGDPSAWRRRPHTPLSLAMAAAGYGCIGIAVAVGGRTAFGNVMIGLGGVLLVVSELRKHPRA